MDRGSRARTGSSGEDAEVPDPVDAEVPGSGEDAEVPGPVDADI